MKTAIVDYGMGNLHSVLKSVQAAQALSGKVAEIYLTARPEDILAADKIIFPGQGAMPDCMAALRQSGLGEAVEDGLKNKPFFGICVGAQLLFEHSEEGDTVGLGWFKGRVKRFPANQTDANGGRLKVPHMGWNRVHPTRPHPLWEGIEPGAFFYFVHSFHAEPTNPENVAATSVYGEVFTCAVTQNNMFATQFHPEKSAASGLRLFRNFIHWRP